MFPLLTHHLIALLVVPVSASEPAPVVSASAGGKVRSSQVKVGELSVYLSGCMTGIHACTPDEQEAVAIVSTPS